MSKKKTNESKAQFVHYFGPLLEALKELGGSGTPDEVVERIAADLKLSDEVQNEVVPSGSSKLKNQIAWARFYLVREGLLDSSVRGVWSLTEKGRQTTISILEATEIRQKWVKVFQSQRDTEPKNLDSVVDAVIEDDEDVESPTHKEKLLAVLLALPTEGFERLSQRILREAGFTQVSVTGRSGDGGIDGHGTLQINPLVSLKVLFQCKRYAGSVSPSHVRDFRGAMAGRADKGIILTTGSFTAEARREATRDGVPPIEVIDGERLISMLENLQLGVRPIRAFEVDQEFFEEFRKP
jgi:restriction system protein